MLYPQTVESGISGFALKRQEREITNMHDLSGTAHSITLQISAMLQACAIARPILKIHEDRQAHYGYTGIWGRDEWLGNDLLRAFKPIWLASVDQVINLIVILNRLMKSICSAVGARLKQVIINSIAYLASLASQDAHLTFWQTLMPLREVPSPQYQNWLVN